jgi:hypothetical protein
LIVDSFEVRRRVEDLPLAWLPFKSNLIGSTNLTIINETGKASHIFFLTLGLAHAVSPRAACFTGSAI